MFESRYEINDKELIKFIKRKIMKNKCNSYTDIRKELKAQYSDMEKEDLEEKLDVCKSKKIMESSMEKGNFTMGCISVVSIAVAVVSTSGKNIDNKSLTPFLCMALALCLMYIFILRYKIKSKGKYIVYYKLLISEIEKELKNRNT
ncbi:hypothetical protein [Clostridium algidicarnis]|uniref:hypothetical protein n=1 Tax=Clostridium algidicarnis TaxID=37659 RepID=UPI001C0B0295|nr:hypothetical protein [Clostridium algidicarnis]MBU3226792.1 hypothetical protein [Clostridium algidicarnis]MBU3250297.1 hypothetical protein [Clostridium algidicarnis]